MNIDMYSIFVILTYLATVLADSQPTIELPNGKIAGLVSKTVRLQKPFYVYLGIPYAAPPIGNLRFQPPQPVQNWEGVLQTTSNRRICFQSQTSKVHIPQTEDCLYLSVFTTKPPNESASLPVMVSIYGGGFTHGYASIGITGPDYLLEDDIVVVTFNYRVGPFGFLSTGDDVIPGNMGLKDQQMALKWVKENIHAFGGDPNRVVIQGQSAGAASVTYHILSPSSAGLFRGAIASSGSALCTWASERPNGRTKAYRIAAEMDPSFTKSKSTQEILELLLTIDAKNISATGTVFVPVVEHEHDGAFISKPMYDSVKNGLINNVPLLIGFNSEEELGKAGDLAKFKNTASLWDMRPATLIDNDMNITDSRILLEAGEKVRPIYTDRNFTEDLAAGIRFFSDAMFIRGVLRYAQQQAKYTDVFVYEFSYHGILGRNNLTLEGCGRVLHGEEGKYFWAGADLTKVPQSDINTLNRFVAIHSNFVKTLNPTGGLIARWPKVTNDHFWYMEIDHDLVVKENPRDPAYRKWVALYDEYAVEPLVAY